MSRLGDVWFWKEDHRGKVPLGERENDKHKKKLTEGSG